MKGLSCPSKPYSIEILHQSIHRPFVVSSPNVNKNCSNLFSVSQTPFVRQNTPHPKDLKSKAQKLLGRSPENAHSHPPASVNGLPTSPPEQPLAHNDVEVS